MWRVEVVRRGRMDWYRINRDGAVVDDWLSISTLERKLAEDYGVAMGDMEPVDPDKAA
ncbi:hypothetical protein [Actinoplanes sp. NPDC089786]|uniref:hypothetical protein n=1 Tax=Actinoplanes sp. NPDC089786 TaxID=3155185 RepID=UPI00343CE318